MALEPVNPPGWKAPRGYANGVVAPAGARLVFVAGQIAWNADQQLVGEGDFAAQFRQALENVVAVVREAGGDAGDLAQLTVFVTDKRKYLDCTRELGAAWKQVVGSHYPAMALVEVADLLEEGALVRSRARRRSRRERGGIHGRIHVPRGAPQAGGAEDPQAGHLGGPQARRAPEPDRPAPSSGSPAPRCWRAPWRSCA